MKINRFKLPSRARLAVSEWLSITLVTLLSVPSAGFAMPRGGVSPRKSGASAVVASRASLAALIEVNTTGDGDNVNPSAGCDADAAAPGEQCSLRAAMQRANALAGDDEIRFNIPATEPNCDTSVGKCTINLTEPLPQLSTNVRIEGPGADKLVVQRNTGGDYRIFTVTFASEVTLSGMRIVGGKPFGVSSGGAIANAGSATVNVADSVLVDNIGGAVGGSGGAISNGSTGTINVTNSLIGGNRVTGFGGGIYNGGSGTVNVIGSAILNNTVTVPAVTGANGGGGGIANADTGTVNVTNSIISENIVTGGDSATSTLRGGGVWNVSTGTVNVTNSVLFTNRASGGVRGVGIANASGSLNVTNSTITGNLGTGGALFGQATVKSTIIAKNNINPFAGVDVSGSFTSAGFNLVGVEDGSTGFNAPTDQKGTVAAALDPKFDPNGVTISVPGISLQVPGLPLCGSPAIDKGTSAGLTGTLTTDLRGAGFPRTVDDPDEPNPADGTDAGAFERQTVCVQSAFTVNTTGDADDVSPGDANCDSDAGASGAQCTLRAAMREANALAGDYVINFAIPTTDPGFDPSAGRHTINLTGALPDITNSNLTFNGPGADRLTVRRHTGGFYRIFTFGGVVETAAISGLTVSRGSTPGDGGGVSFSGRTLNVQGCVFSDNTAGGSGGGIFANAALNVTDSTFSGNFSGGTSSFAGGGGIFVTRPLSVANSTFSDNLAIGAGGGISSTTTNGNVDSHITDSTFDRNGADAGGGVSVGNSVGSVMRVTNCAFRRNTSTLINSQGGGIYHFFGTLNVTGSTISGNEGFGVDGNAASGTTTNITDSTISGNTRGGIRMDFATAPTGKLNVTNSTISGNTGGPGIRFFSATLNVTNSTISHNETGGMIRDGVATNPGTWTIKSSIIAANAGFFSDVTGNFTSGGFNLIGKADGSTGFTHPTDQTGTVASPLDPKLDPAGLQNNGGPTQTIALQPDSPAIDKGTAAGLTGALATDQRGTGFTRTFDEPAVTNAVGGDGTDIGAFERNPAAPTPTPTPTPSPSPTPAPSPTPTPTPASGIVAAGSTLVQESCPPANDAVDPGERVSLNLTLRNGGANGTSNLVATLQPSANVIAPSGPQSYGSIAPNGTATRTYTLTADGNCGGQITLMLRLQDGAADLGTVSYTVTLGAPGAICNTSCQIPRLVVTTTPLARSGCGDIALGVTVQNIGVVDAADVTLTTGTLNSPTTGGTPLPRNLGDLGPGQSATTVITFSGANNPAGAMRMLRFDGTFSGGVFNGTRRVTLP